MSDKKHQVITTQKNKDGEFVLVDSDSNEVQEGYGYDTQADAMKAAAQLWPANSVWEGVKTLIGWRIKVD